MSRSERAHLKKAAKVLAASPVSGGAFRAAPDLLGAVAAALNDLERAGTAVRLAHNAVITESGYVFALGPDGAPWQVRTRLLTEFPVIPGDD